ncbi:uncharacterized protein LOC142990400 [Genypterus blacodes]|uniref:uncharacterized protein LOC142990400 n=1 Tax=Genypterus blacodes TaxID=154954 RepID=UPI003F75EF48
MDLQSLRPVHPEVLSILMVHEEEEVAVETLCLCCFLFLSLLRLPSALLIPEFRSPSHGGGLNRSASLSCTERAPEGGSVGGSNSQLPGTPAQYVPDFCVRALSDLQFVKITRAQYQNGLLASRLDSGPQSPDGSHPRLDTCVSVPPVTPPPAHPPPPLAVQPGRHQATPPVSRPAFPQAASSSSSPKPSLSLSPQGNPHLTPTSSLTSRSQVSPPSGETSTLLSEQLNRVGARRASHGHSPAPPHLQLHVHTITNAHTESTI